MVRLVNEPRQNPAVHGNLGRSLTSIARSSEGHHNANECRIVIDIGTARLYLVYTLPGSDTFQEVYDWDITGTQEYNHPITFTELYYLPENRRRFWNGRGFLWGREVDHERRKLNARNQELDPRRHVRFFKPAIHEVRNSNWYDKELNEQARFLFGDPNPGVKQFALDFMNGMKDVVFVFTMPSGWEIHEYEIFQQPVEKWGLQQTQIQYVPESDATIRYWISKEGGKLGAIKTNSIVVNADIGAGTIDISVKRIVSFNEINPEFLKIENALPQRGLKHGIERIVNVFEENIRHRLKDYPPHDAKIMARCAAEQFRTKWNDFEDGDVFDLPGLPENIDFFVTREELTEPYQTAISAVVEVLENILQDLVKLQYSDYPMCILLSGGGTSHTILVDALQNRFPEIPFHCMSGSELKKGCAKGAFLESRDRTNFTQHKFARASYAIKSRQPCSAPGDANKDPSAEEIRMLQLDPTAERIYDKALQRYHFKKSVNDWFAKLHDPLVWIPENFVWRHWVVQSQSDLDFVDVLVEFKGHPGPGSFTIYDEETENYTLEYIQVDLRRHLKARDMGRANDRYKDYKPKLLQYCYKVEMSEDDRPIFFVLFRHSKDMEIRKVRVYPTGALDLARLEGHRNLDDPAFSRILDNPSSETSARTPLTAPVKRNQDQCGLSSAAGSHSPARSKSKHSGSTLRNPKRQKTVALSSFKVSSTSRTSAEETSTPSIDKTSRPYHDIKSNTGNSINFQEQAGLDRRSRRQNLSSVRAAPGALTSIDPNIKRHDTGIQPQKSSLLPRPKRAPLANAAVKL